MPPGAPACFDPPMGPSPLTRRLLLAGASSLLAGGAGLALVRWLERGVYALPTESDEIIDALVVEGARLNLLKAGLRGARVVVPDRPHDPLDTIDPRVRAAMGRRRVFTVDTNRLRLRGTREAEDLPSPRLLLLGDSVAFGWGVDFKDSIGERLSDELDRPVLCAGVPAMRPAQLQHWARMVLGQLKVETVLVLIRPRVDELPALAALFRTIASLSEAKPALVLSPLSSFDLRGARSRTTLADAVREAIPGLPVLEATDTLWLHPPPGGVLLQAQGQRQELIETTTGATLRSVIGPDERVAPEIYAAFEEDPSLREPFFFDGGHVDAEGSRLLAQDIAGFLRLEGLDQPTMPAVPHPR